jgi:hypothetical protein
MKKLIMGALVFLFASISLTGCAVTAPKATPNAVKPAPDLRADLANSRRSNTQNVEWTVVQNVNIKEPADIKGLPQPEGRWEVHQGKLVAVEGKRNRAILLAKSGHDPVRVEFDATLYPDAQGRIGDITVLLNSKVGGKAKGWQKEWWRSGYALTTASYWNQCTAFYRQGICIARTEYSPAKPRKQHHIKVEFVGGHIRYWLDNVILLDAWHPKPLPMSPDAWIGLRTWSTRMTVENVVISKGRILPKKKKK